jgi:hypothetical protein
VLTQGKIERMRMRAGCQDRCHKHDQDAKPRQTSAPGMGLGYKEPHQFIPFIALKKYKHAKYFKIMFRVADWIRTRADNYNIKII